MGSKSSREEKAPEPPKPKQVLLLGMPGCGKSTLCKQLQLEFGQGFNAEQKQNWGNEIRRNIIETMVILVEQSRLLGVENSSTQLVSKGAAVAQYKIGRPDCESGEINERVEWALKSLWPDWGIQKTYSMRHKFHRYTDMNYFMDKIESLRPSDYCPSNDDILRIHTPTTDVEKHQLSISNDVFEIFDFGGGENERSKAIEHYESAAGVVFMMDLSQREHAADAINYFTEICHHPHLQSTTIVLVFNKMDLLEESLSRSMQSSQNLSVLVDQAANDLQDQFHRPQRPDKPIYVFRMCAINNLNVRASFSSVAEMISRAAVMNLVDFE
eukprot:TRINITY_DN3549_c0_g1_i1.p1 TRINITY_DN3549_c0_g1~~TRINITY_DN3549_c0_g1_i1.p1  ORF type:complete len:349 (+),score=19.94 TRINITY_DN3549_c0_g1_i1:69-1049(+)